MIVKLSYLYTILSNESRFLWAATRFSTLYFMSPKDISLTISSLVEISESDFVIQNSSSFFLMGRNGNSISSRCRKKWSYLRKFFCYYGAWFSVYSFSHTHKLCNLISQAVGTSMISKTFSYFYITIISTQISSASCIW